MLVIEAKPGYSKSDREKLKALFENKKELMISSIRKFCDEHMFLQDVAWDNVSYVPTLAFYHESLFTQTEEHGFAHIYVKSLSEAKIVFFEEAK